MTETRGRAHRPSLNDSQTTWIRARKHGLAPLPEPDKTWSFVETDPAEFEDAGHDAPDVCGVDISWSALSKGLENGVIKSVEQCTGLDDHWRLTVYRTDRRCHAFLQSQLDKTEARDGYLPCDHDAIDNVAGLTDDDGRPAVRCGIPSCQQVHAKADVRAHNSGGEGQ